MAVEIHTAYVGLIQVAPDGTKVDKYSASIAEVQMASSAFRVLEDTSIPSTINNPSIRDYLNLEAAASFQLIHLDQTFIITQKVT